MVDKLDDKKRGKKGGKDKEDLKSISKTMCFILRHDSSKYGIQIEPNGFVEIDELLNAAPLKKFNVSKETLRKIVDTDEKGRYEISENKIRCVQGHSNAEVVPEESLELITNIYDYNLVVHGTYSDSWDKIKSSGLNKMKRNAIHFSIGYPKDENVKSGMRGNCNVFIELNAAHCFHNGFKFFISKNQVVLTPGDQTGTIPPHFFKIVYNKDGEILQSQRYQTILFLNLSKPNKEIKLFIKEAIFLDMEAKSVIHSEFFESGKDDSNLDSLAEFILGKEILKKSFAVCVNSKDMFLEVLKNKDHVIKHKSLFNDFLHKSFQINVEDIEKFFTKLDKEAFDSRFLYRIAYHPPFLKKADKEEKKEEEKKEVKKDNKHSGMMGKDHDAGNQLKKKKEEEEKQEKNFKLKPDHLSNDKLKKNLLFIICSFNKSTLFSINTFLVLDNDFTKPQEKLFNFGKKKGKSDVKDTFEEIKKIVKNYLNKNFITCVIKDDLEFLKNEISAQGGEAPKFLEKNVLLLDPKLFSGNSTQEITETFLNNLKKFSANDII